MVASLQIVVPTFEWGRGAHQRHIGGSGPNPTFRRVLSTRSGRSAHCAQSDSSSTASAWARPRQATQWSWLSGGFSRSRADTAVGRHLTGNGREGKDSDVIVVGSALILPLELGILACFATIGLSVRLT